MSMQMFSEVPLCYLVLHHEPQSEEKMKTFRSYLVS